MAKMDFSKSKNNVLQQTLAKADETNARIVKNIPLSDIVETPENEYIFGIRPEDVERLAEEIKENGFTGSIDVIDLHNGKYQVFAGHQRLHAVALLKWETIPCTVSDDMSEDELYRKLISSNILTRKITPLSYARAIDEYKKKVLISKKRGDGKVRDQVAHFFNIANGQVPRYEVILEMPEELQKRCDDFNFPYSVLVNAKAFSAEQKETLCNNIEDYIAKYGEDALSGNIINTFIETIKERENKKNKEKDSSLAKTDYDDAWGREIEEGTNSEEFSTNDVFEESPETYDEFENNDTAETIPAENVMSESPKSQDGEILRNDFYIKRDVQQLKSVLRKMKYEDGIEKLEDDVRTELLECKKMIEEMLNT